MQNLKAVEQVFATLEARDPGKTTLCVGGAAIAIHLAAADVPITGQVDVDVLCSHDYFEQLCASSAVMAGLSKFQIRWPYGDEDVRALRPLADIYPDEEHANLLPFSACEALGGIWFPIYYDECIQTPERVVLYRGYKFLDLAKLLMWTAFSGRDKDLAKLDALLPIVRYKQLVREDDFRQITREYEKSVELRKQFPTRFHARVRNGDFAKGAVE